MPTAPIPSPPRKILVVEDNAFLRHSIGASLTHAGYRVIPAADGEAAITLTLAEHPDLILLDLILPKINGFEVLRRLKANSGTAPIPVLVLSELHDDPDIEQALQWGAANYLVKSLHTTREIRDRIDAFFATHEAI